jgi:Ca2+-binding EF-hand superfamily protein
MFKKLDKDGDGRLSTKEVQEGLETLMHSGDLNQNKRPGEKKAPCSKHPPDEYKKMMEGMDRNGDGEITWDEFVAASINKIALLN